MSKYIDADKLLEKLPDDLPYKASVKRVLMQAPAADVVPKSEVEKLSIELLHAKEDYGDLFATLVRVKTEVAREIFEEIESISSDFPIYGNINTVILSERDLAFIKKKYTEEGK